MIFHVDADAWRPAEREAGYRSAAELTANQIVIWDRRPYRIIETRDRDPLDWDTTVRDRWAEHGCPDPAHWRYRPLVIVLRDEDQPTAKPLHLCGSASVMWRTLPEHYAVCRRCGELPPCREVHNDKVAERATERFEQEMAIMPGCCHACHEPVTSRQKVYRFDGPNLMRPDLGNGSALFHLRAACRLDLKDYDRRWAAAAPGRRRSFYCDGKITHHHDDTKTCPEPDCPSVDVDHRSTEWHRPGVYAVWSGCWCVSGDLTTRVQRNFNAEEQQ